ncbi:MAG: hypothetical protein O3B88_05805 [Bacteroidetes bacterium]|nr:hypothetical protein [Bacteroidota bacterium]
MNLKGTIALCLIVMGPVLFAQKDSTAISASANLKRFMTFYFESIKHRAMENPELALKALDAAQRIKDLNQEQQSAIAYEQGKNHALLQDFDRAIRAFELAQIHPEFKRAAQMSLYDIYHQQGAYEHAIVVVKALSKIDNDYAVDLIKLQLEMGNLDRAQIILDSISDSWGPSLELQSIDLELQKRRLARQNQSDGAGFEPKDYLKYKELLEGGLMDQALMILKRIISAADLAPKAKAQALEAFAAQSLEKQYQESFERLVPDLERLESVSIEVALGRYFLDQLDLDRAQRHGQKALDLEPNNKEALLLMASVDFALEDPQSGLQRAEMALALYPADPWCYLMAARGYRFTGMFALAERQLLSGIEFTLAGSNQYRLLCLEAVSLYKELGRAKEAELWLDKAQQ